VRVAREIMLADERSESRNRTRVQRRLAVPPVLGLILLLGIPVAGQSPYPQFPSTNSGRNGQLYPDNSGQFGADSNSPEKQRMRMLNAERQKALVSDTEKLLKLARELNDEVAARDSSGLTGEQLHKLDEIGKLARSVKAKMSFSGGDFPGLNSPLTIPPRIQ